VRTEGAVRRPSHKSPVKAQNHAGVLQRDRNHLYRERGTLPLNGWSLAGDWRARPEFAEHQSGTGAISFRFHARDVHLVMATSDRPIRFRVRINGAEPGPNHGSDIDASGMGEVKAARMYQLVRQAGAVSDRTFQIEFLDSGVRAFCFTFG
jgi:hypothetical protein